MDTNEFITKILIPVSAALGGGLIGSLLTSKNQKRLIVHNDKKFILATLMGMRHEGVKDYDFVKALNMIVVVFHDNAKVKENYHQYLTYTGSEMYSGGQRVEVLFRLLAEMAKDIGYTEVTHNDVKDFYYPPWKEDKDKPDKIDQPTK